MSSCVTAFTTSGVLPVAIKAITNAPEAITTKMGSEPDDSEPITVKTGAITLSSEAITTGSGAITTKIGSEPDDSEATTVRLFRS